MNELLDAPIAPPPPPQPNNKGRREEPDPRVMDSELFHQQVGPELLPVLPPIEINPDGRK